MKSHKVWWAFVIVGAVVFAGLFAFSNHTKGIAAAPSGAISGFVWQDYCGGDCEAGSSLKRGNGIVNNAERKLAGITVMLSKGKCADKYATISRKTNAGGYYHFSNLANGWYCVTVNSKQSNTAFRKPGYWTRPATSASQAIAKYQIKITGPQEVVNTSFGWNYK